MRKFLCLMLSVLMLCCMVPVSVSAEPVGTNKTLYLEIGLSGNMVSTKSWLVPEFDLNVNVDGYSTSVTASGNDFEGDSYSLEIPLEKPLEANSTLELSLVEARDLNTPSTLVNGFGIAGEKFVGINEPTSITLVETEPYLDAPISLMGANKDNPVVCTLGCEAGNQMLIVVSSPSGDSVSGVSLFADAIGRDGVVEFITNPNGLALIDLTPLADESGVFKGSLEFFPNLDSTYTIISNNYKLVDYSASNGSLPYFKIEVVNTERPEKVDEFVENQTSTNVNVVCNSDYNLDMYKPHLAVTLMGADGMSYKLDNLVLGTNDVELPKQSYVVSVESDNASVHYSPDFVVGTDYEISIVPTHRLDVKGSDDFEVLNVAALEGKSYKPTTFAVSPEQSIMLRDNVSGKSVSVYIEKDHKHLVVDFEKDNISTMGNISTSDGSPKTGDGVDMLLGLGILLILLLVGMGIKLYSMKKSKDKPYSLENSLLSDLAKRGSKLLSLVLVATILASALPVLNSDVVYAGSSSTGVIGSGGGSHNVSGNLQAWNIDYYSALIKVHLVTEDYISKGASIEDLANQQKFWSSESDLFIATNQKDYQRWQNGGLIRYTDANNGGYYHEYGSAWYNMNEVVNQEEKMARTLPIATDRNTLSWSDNEWVKFILPFFNEHKNLHEEFGKDLDTYIRTNLNLNGDNPDKKAYTDLVIADYLRYLKETVGVSEGAIADYQNAYASGKLSIIFEIMPGAYRMNVDAGVNSVNGWYMTVSDAMKIMKWSGSSIEYPLYEVQVLGDNFTSGNYRRYSCNGKCGNSNCSLIGHLRFSQPKVIVEKYLRTLQPMNDALKDYAVNPFGGWAFFKLGTGNPTRELQPGIYADIVYHIMDSNDNEIGSFTESVEGYSYSNVKNNHLVLSGSDLDGGILDDEWSDETTESLRHTLVVPASVEKDGKLYVSDDAGAGMRMYATDTVAEPINVVNFLVSDIYNISYETILKTLGTDIGVKLNRPSVEPTEDWDYTLSTALAAKLHSYLGNTTSEGMYFGEMDKAGNVHVIFDVNVHEEPVETTAVTADFEVPEWRINKYFPTILKSGEKAADSTFKLVDLIKDTGCSRKTSKLSSESSARFILDNPVIVGNIPALTDALTNYSLSRTIKHKLPQDKIKIYGDLMLFKDSNIDDLGLASWVHSHGLKYGTYGIGRDSGVQKNAGKSIQDYVFKLSYSYSPVQAITHKYTVHGGHTKTRGCACYYGYETPATEKTSAVYDSSALFKCYNHSVIPSGVFSTESYSDDGYYEIAKQSENGLGLFAEVPMLYTDVNGNDAVYFVTADNKTELKPIVYHTISNDIRIEPAVVGINATDSRAASKSASVGVNTIFNKGSGITSSYEIDGNFQVKTYAIDVNSANLKSNWQISDYSAANESKKFLESFAIRTSSGGYNVDMSVKEEISILSNFYSGLEKSIMASSEGTSSKEYVLTVRAGEITAINGYTNWQSKYPNLVPVVEKMKLNHSGVFGVFASGAGDKLTEANFERLSKALREDSSSIAVGKGWYSEDTTVLSLFEYTTEFKIPNLLFANKIPQSVSGLETPQNKDLFYNKVAVSALLLDIKLDGKSSGVDFEIYYDSLVGGKYSEPLKLFGVANVSVLDTTINQ